MLAPYAPLLSLLMGWGQRKQTLWRNVLQFVSAAPFHRWGMDLWLRVAYVWKVWLQKCAAVCLCCSISQVGDGFVIKSGVCVEGVTPEMLHSFYEDFLISGTCYLRLRKLVERNVTTGSHMQEGLMFQVSPVPVCFTKWRATKRWSWKVGVVLEELCLSLFSLELLYKLQSPASQHSRYPKFIFWIIQAHDGKEKAN